MSGRHARNERSARRSAAGTAAVAASCVLITPVALNSPTIAATLANYVIGVGGNDDPSSANIKNKLGGQYRDANGIEYLASIWPVSGLTAPTFAQSVNDGNGTLGAAISNSGSPNTADDHVVVVGYSLGAVVANKQRRELETDPDDAPANLEFVLIANANKPNGGIFARFPWLYVPLADIQSTGAVGPDQFTTTDITREYDPYGDFPAYFNPLSLANAAAAVVYVHPDANYDNIDMSQYSDDNAVSSETNGDTTTYHYSDGTTKTVVNQDGEATTTYYVIHTDHLPLLMPLRQAADALGLPQGGIDAVEPVVRTVVDMGYDRTTSPATATQFSFITPPQKFVEAAQALPGAAQQGVNNFQDPPPAVQTGIATEPTQVRAPANTAAAQINSTPSEKPARLIPLTLPSLTKPAAAAPETPAATDVKTGVRTDLKKTLKPPKLSAPQRSSDLPKMPSLRDAAKSLTHPGTSKTAKPNTDTSKDKDAA
ncbi:PE-PPE domain-containing protein [Mycobacterium sp. 141]|uniref:PE-PPE domain-containing protein n=1 Tax=Mycobacterium sp. 141 TaxID=1120797 RepID=UPI000475C8C4|nr:PE-PPE domain-containing protein [Mycobacterium sp. 141]